MCTGRLGADVDPLMATDSTRRSGTHTDRLSHTTGGPVFMSCR
jgi:hypothetical protein